ncbi:MAG: TRAP transporter large permease [Myxococcota bacterium]
MTAWVVLLLVLLLAAGFPMMVPLLAAALLLVGVFLAPVDPSLLVQQMIGGVSPSVLTAVPMFIFAADLMTRGHTAERLLDLVLRSVGHRRGGLPITTALSCTLFGSVSGSTQATVVAMGGALRPRLLERGYPDGFAMALIINASDIALLIPPSIGMIVYGVVSGTSVGELFIAGIGPGLLILAAFSAYSWIIDPRFGVEPLERASSREWLGALSRAVLPLGFPVIVIGGIYSGLFSPTEAAAMSVLYALVLELLVFRAVRLVEIPDIAVSTGIVTAVVFILVAAGAAFSWAISFAQIPNALLADIVPMVSESPWKVLAMISVAYFVGCMFVDPIVVIMILTPIFAPAVDASGVDPVWVGTLVTLQAAIGSATPPFGCDIFTAMAVFRRPYVEVIRGTPPFVLILLGISVVLILFPSLTLGLRDLAYR